MKLTFLGLTLLVLFLCSCSTPCPLTSYRDTVIIHQQDPFPGPGWIKIDTTNGWKLNLPIADTGKVWLWNDSTRKWIVSPDTTKMGYDWYVDTVGVVNSYGMVNYQPPVRIPKNFFHCPPNIDSLVFIKDPTDLDRIRDLEKQLKMKDNDFATVKKDYEALKPNFWIFLLIAAGGWLLALWKRKK